MDPQQLDDTVSRLITIQRRFRGDCACAEMLPDRHSIETLCKDLLGLIFPGYFTTNNLYPDHVDTFTRQRLLEVEDLLARQLTRAYRFRDHCENGACPAHPSPRVSELLAAFFTELPHVSELVASDVEAMFRNDPAATDASEIIAAYPGLEAIAVQRLAHVLYQHQVPIIPRMMTEVAHSRTGIDINPGATIGESFAIDHGTGIVIGETCVIGDHCMLYHGVTLGAFNPLRKDEGGNLPRGAGNKRHPDLDDHVIVYPGATILGGDTRVGHHSVVGGNVWLTHSVEPYSKVTIEDPNLVIRNHTNRHAPA